MIKILELFGGIGACSKALERLGINYEIADYVEIDKYAVNSFNAMHNTDFEPQDISKWDKDIEVDLIMHGSPCQDFSLAGKQAGGDKDSGTRSSLMYETIRIVEKLKPKYVIWENVKNLLSKKHIHNFNAYLETMEQLGYKNYYQVLNAKDYGIPQNRERVFTVSILGNGNYEFPKGVENTNKIIEHNPKGRHQQDFIQDEDGLCRCIPAGTHGSTPHLLKTLVRNYEFPPKQELKLKLKDMLEDEVDEKYYLSEEWVKKIKYEYENNTICETRYDEGIRTFKDNICGSLRTIDAGGNKCVIQVKNATKQGYQEAYEGDSVNLTYPDSKTRRGRVGEQVSQTLQTSDNMGVVVDKSRKDIKELDRYCEYCGNKLERKRFNGRLEDFTVFKNRKYCNRECMQKAYLKIGEHNQNWSNAHTTARKINELILHKEVCELCGSDSNLDIHHIDGNWQNNNLDNLMCLCRSCHTKYERNKDKTELRIRKLTPREVWRLMGFDDEDFEKAAFKKETSYIEGGLKCNAKLKIVNEKQRHLDMETYALCTTNDMLDMETPIRTKRKKSIENENNEKMQNVNIAIEMLDEVEQKECVTNIIKCGENTTILYTLMEELDQHHMAIIELGKRGKANIEKYMKITLEENLNPMKLYTISILIEQIIKSKIYTCITQKANIQGNIAIIEDCVKNLKMMKLSNLKMEYITRLNSDTMLYKQAGNSICVPVLMAIFKELIK